MMLSPNGEKYYMKVICVKEIRQKDKIWGTLEVNVGDIRWALKKVFYKSIHTWDGCHLIKYDSGLWPVDCSNFKTLDELRDDKLNELGI